MCVRVTDLRGVDLERYSFDFDLTFAALVAHPAGPVLHRYGGRDHHSADARLTMSSFVRFLEAARARYDAYSARREDAEREAEQAQQKRAEPRTLDDIPVWREKMAQRKQRLDCYHCHYVFDAEREQRRADGTWSRERIWRWPPPERVGLTLEVEDLGRVRAVRAGSPAALAGLEAGDRLLSAAGQPILTALDLSFVFEGAPSGAVKLPLRYARGAAEAEAVVDLPAGWKEGTPLEFSWRPSKWQLAPRPGFGGPALSAAERVKLGLPASGLAFRVDYIVDWGSVPDRRYGVAARQAGIRKGDLILGVKGVELEGPEHLHSWWRLTRKAGDVVVLRVLRAGEAQERELSIEVQAPPD